MVKVIKVEDLYFKYNDTDEFALKGVSFDIEKGESVGLIGPNGAGKTTLLLNLVGVLKGSGYIEILKLPLKKKNLREIRKKVGFLFQNPDDQLFNLTVWDDLSFGLLNLGLKEDEIKKRIEDVLNWLDLKGYETKSPHHLSFGEKKRIALATVLVLKPEIFIFDEPTSNLDYYSKIVLMEYIKSLNQTKIIASHDLDFIYKVTDKVILLNNGKIIEIGKTEKILGNEKLLKSNKLYVPLLLRIEKLVKDKSILSKLNQNLE